MTVISNRNINVNGARSASPLDEAIRAHATDPVQWDDEYEGEETDDSLRVSQDRQVRQDRRDFSVIGGVAGETCQFLKSYIVLPDVQIPVLTAWVMAAWLMDIWDRFPHLAIKSPEKRCGKTLLLQLLFHLAPRGHYTSNISPAVLYRMIEAEHPTLLMDESQSLSRRGSEASEVIREILNAGIERNSTVTRCGGERWESIQKFSVYSPKIFAMIGEPDAVLADRCLGIPLRRKTKEDRRERYRSRAVESKGKELHDKLEAWSIENAEKVEEVYADLEPFDIDNDRMADLLLPLQAVLSVAGSEELMEMLEQYAKGIDEHDKEVEMQSPGVRLLTACRDIFGDKTTFLGTETLRQKLVERQEEPWYRWNHGNPITRETLANLLRPYGIRPGRNTTQTRGYHRADFEESWTRYLPTSKLPAISSIPPNRSDWQSMPDGDDEKYRQYLLSPEWAEKRDQVFFRSHGVCERCGDNKADEAHHKTYARRYRERLEDLEAVCQDCHARIHEKKARA